MSSHHVPASTWFSQLTDTSVDLQEVPGTTRSAAEVLQDILTAQDRTNELLEELVQRQTAVQRQKQNELRRFRNSHPQLARDCNRAATALTRVQIELLRRLTEEVELSAEELVDGEFVLSEFIDRFGPKMAHLNNVIHFLGQVSSTTETVTDLENES